MWTNKEDPVMTCQPLGIPRQGPPRRIVQSPTDVIFLYGQYADGGGGYGEYRVIPTDGRQHDESEALQTKYMGYTVGHWEGDTLVLDSVSFNDYTWLARGGFFHSDKMRVVERFTRQGNEVVLRSHRRGPRGARGAVGDDAANAAAQPECRRGTHARAR